MTHMEWIAALLGIACVALAARRSVWTFPAGIASVALVGIVVFEARLYSDALLQLFFVAANTYGWVRWRAVAAAAGEVVVERMAPAARLCWLAGIAIAGIGWGEAMHRLTDAAYPWWDAWIAAASIAAQVLMAQRRTENWLLWIAVDLASIPLYLAKGLTTLAALYLVYLLLAVWGLIGWMRAERRALAAVAPA